MRILLSLSLALLAWASVPLLAQGAFTDGENLHYSAKWTGIPAGEIKLATEIDGGRYQFELKAKTNTFWSMVYKVRDVITSEVEIDKFRSIRYREDSRQGRRHVEEIVLADYQERTIKRIKQNHSAKESAHEKTFALDEEWEAIQDPLSMVYHLRNFEFKNPKELDGEIPVFVGKEVYRLQYAFKGELVFESSIFGSRRAWRIEPKAHRGGVLYSKGKMEMIVDCVTGVPLRITFHIPVGWARLELKRSNHPKLMSKSFRQRRGK
jgi:hypothetical protein